ncbi:hypothetical protein NY055_01995 [Corynebacterium diphtheriae bv. mitis]|nr:hypothetical protein NY055_01995 [Corynebacterium diphtheriae bv. mitis]
MKILHKQTTIAVLSTTTPPLTGCGIGDTAVDESATVKTTSVSTSAPMQPSSITSSLKNATSEQLPPENIVEPTPQDTTSDSPAQQASLIWTKPGAGFQCGGTDAAIPAEKAMRDPSTVPYAEGGTIA